MKRLAKLAPLMVAAAFAAPVQASDPIGVYALIDKVVLEPDDSAPQRVQIWGVFALADGQRGDNYLPAQRGYVYYALSPGKEEICRKEWADLRATAGTGQAIGFGSRYQPKGRLRAAADKPEAPDPYPTGFGLVKVRNRPQLEKDLKSVPPPK